MPFTMSCEWDNHNALQNLRKQKVGRASRDDWHEKMSRTTSMTNCWENVSLIQRFVPVPYLKTAYSYSHRESERSFGAIKVRVYSCDCTINADAPRIVFQKEAKLTNIVPKRSTDSSIVVALLLLCIPQQLVRT